MDTASVLPWCGLASGLIRLHAPTLLVDKRACRPTWFILFPEKKSHVPFAPPPPARPNLATSLPVCACLYLTSTAVMDYLAQPAPASLPADDVSANGGGGVDAGSDHGSDGYFTSDDLLLNEDDERGSRHTAASSSSYHRRPFSSGKADGGSGPSAAGQAVAGAALASDYGTWLKRLAVRLRRATPAGERFVRLRCISPAVTGEQVVNSLLWITGIIYREVCFCGQIFSRETGSSGFLRLICGQHLS